MSLSDEVQNRYDSQVLTELTNIRESDAASVDTTVLGRACDDIELAWFQQYAQQEYDSTDRKHILVAVDGVVALLQRWGGKSSRVARIEWESWIASARDLASVSSRARIVPQSSSELTPSDEVSSGETVRPWSDPDHFRGLTPRNVPTDSGDDS